jgi:DNA-binding winged helix-turn-helix (wHTH) protein/tetratricopeptide (TPR) repeat protein
MWLFGPYRLDVADQCLWRGNTRIPLMPKPFAVLKYLVERAGRLVAQDELVAAIWPDTHVQPDVLRRYILELRRVLDDAAESPQYIETLTKRGYRFVATVAREGPPTPVAEGGGGSTLAGRETAFAELDRCLQNALCGERQICLVAGEAGIGKTSLVDAFQLSLNRNPAVQVMRGQCIEGFGGKEPYYPILEATERLVRDPGMAYAIRPLTATAPTWMIQFPGLLRPENRAALQQDVLGATRERMVREFCEAIEVITHDICLVLILEDLHWADNSTLDVLSMVARRRNPAKFLLVGTFRPEDLLLSESPLRVLKQDLLSHGLCRELKLDVLGPADVSGYLAKEFRDNTLPADFAAMIHRHSEGNPLFMTSVLDHLTRSGVLARTNGSWQLTVPVDRIDPGVPDTLKSMLDVQLGHLSEAERWLLKCASVAGQHFTVCSVAIMLEDGAPVVERQCAALAERQQFVKSCGICELPNGAYTIDYEFRHSLYRDALYHGLNPSERIRLHRLLAQGLVGYESPLSPVLAAKIAAHFEEGRQYEPAIHHLMVAAETASRRYSHRESLTVLDHARDLLPKVGCESRDTLDREILGRIADTYYTLGEMTKSIAAYDMLAARAAAVGNRAVEAEALMRMSNPASFVDPDRAIVASDRAAELGAAIPDLQLAARATMLAACWRNLLHGWNEADARRREAASAVLRESGAEMPAFGRLPYARALLYESEYTKAIEHAEQALQQLSGGDCFWAAPVALHVKASALGYLGRLGETHLTLARGFELAQKDGNLEWLAVLRYTLFWLGWHTFDFSGMREFLAGVSTDMGALSLQIQLPLIAAAGFAHLAHKEYPSAIECFERVLDRPDQPRCMLQWRAEILARHGLGEAWMALGELATARVQSDAFVAVSSTSRDRYLAAIAYEFAARLFFATGERDRARQMIVRAVKTVAAVDVPLAAWRVHGTAWAVYREHDPAKAESHQRTSAEIIGRIAKSLEGVEPLHRSFLAAEPIRGILDEQPAAAISPRPSTRPKKRSRTSV